MKKKTIIRFCLFFILILSIKLGFSQQVQATAAQVQQFFKTTTYFVLNSDLLSGYNEQIKASVTKYWKVTPYQFITLSEFEQKRFSDKNSFVMYLEAEVPHKKDISLDLVILNFVLGDKTKDLSLMPDLGSLILAYADEDEDNYLYKLDTWVQLMQKNIKLVSENPQLTPLKLLNHYNSFNDKVKNYELWIVQDDTSPETNTFQKIQAVYPYKFKLVKHEELAEAIKNQKSDIVFFSSVQAEEEEEYVCYKFITSTDGKIFYIDHQDVDKNNAGGLLIKDLKKLK